MAKIETIHKESSDLPSSTETVEVRIWGLGGSKDQLFYFGNGANDQANHTIWLEIIYNVEGVPILYTRNFLQQFLDDSVAALSSLESRLDEIDQLGEGEFGFGELLPETRLHLSIKKSTCKLEISLDTGAVFGGTSPGERSVEIQINDILREEGTRFMRELIGEIMAAQQGKHPDPGSYPKGSSEWPFVWQINRQAYNLISETYQEDYFENFLLTEGFDDWLKQIPAGGNILDAGCGHGQPVMARLLEKSFQVTGSDISPEMLQRAGQRFPQAKLLRQAISTLTQQAAYDGICSFSALLYLDPIDFLNSIVRLHCALKPGGLLFLYAYDTAPAWRGIPFHHNLGQWMWSWHYGMAEAVHLLEEHGYFEVLETREVAVDEKEQQRITDEVEKQRQAEEEYRQNQAHQPDAYPLPFKKISFGRAPYGYLIIARRGRRL